MAYASEYIEIVLANTHVYKLEYDTRSMLMSSLRVDLKQLDYCNNRQDSSGTGANIIS